MLALVQKRALRVIAAFEALKGLAALAVIVGLVDLMHHDFRHLVIELIGHFGLNPHAHYSSILLHYADLLPGANIPMLVGVAIGYIALRWIEAYGLWNQRRWAEYLGAISGGLYIPFEVAHFVHHVSLINLVVLAANAFLVGFLTLQLSLRARRGAPH